MAETSRRGGGGEADQLPARNHAAPAWSLTSASAPDAGLVRRVDLAMAAWRAMVSSMVPDRDLT